MEVCGTYLSSPSRSEGYGSVRCQYRGVVRILFLQLTQLLISEKDPK